MPGEDEVTVPLPKNRLVKAACIFLLFASGVIALTGHGLIVIVSGILGVLFAIEGYWGAVNYDAGAIRRFIVFMLVFIALFIALGVISLATVDEYCKTAEGASERKDCDDTATATGIIYMIGGLTVVPACAIIMGLFYRQLIQAGKDAITQAKITQRQQRRVGNRSE